VTGGIFHGQKVAMLLGDASPLSFGSATVSSHAYTLLSRSQPLKVHFGRLKPASRL